MSEDQSQEPLTADDFDIPTTEVEKAGLDPAGVYYWEVRKVSPKRDFNGVPVASFQLVPTQVATVDDEGDIDIQPFRGQMQFLEIPREGKRLDIFRQLYKAIQGSFPTGEENDQGVVVLNPVRLGEELIGQGAWNALNHKPGKNGRVYANLGFRFSAEPNIK